MEEWITELEDKLQAEQERAKAKEIEDLAIKERVDDLFPKFVERIVEDVRDINKKVILTEHIGGQISAPEFDGVSENYRVHLLNTSAIISIKDKGYLMEYRSPNSSFETMYVARIVEDNRLMFNVEGTGEYIEDTVMSRIFLEPLLDISEK